MSEHVTLRDLALSLGMDRSHAHRFAKRHVTVFKARCQESRQLVNAVSTEDADRLREMRSEFGSTRRSRASNGDGYVYLIQLLPDLAPNRLKVGYANDVDARLRDHRCTCPEAKMLKAWAMPATWEAVALDLAFQRGKRVGPEVLEADPDEISEVLNRLHALRQSA